MTLEEHDDRWDEATLCDEDDDWEALEHIDDFRYEFEFAEDYVMELCYGAVGFERIADFAPIHVALKFIANAVRAAGLNPRKDEGAMVFLGVCEEVISDSSILEHNPWIACFACPNEVLPLVDKRFLARFWQWQTSQITLPEFYRCPGCGAPFSASKSRREPDRHLPWYHYVYEDDFDVRDEEKPKA